VADFTGTKKFGEENLRTKPNERGGSLRRKNLKKRGKEKRAGSGEGNNLLRGLFLRKKSRKERKDSVRVGKGEREPNEPKKEGMS